MRPFDPSPESVRTSTVSDVVQRPTEQRPSVLLADDAERFSSIVRSVLEDDGYKVVAEAADATKTIERARQHRPEVVVLALVDRKADVWVKSVSVRVYHGGTRIMKHK